MKLPVDPALRGKARRNTETYARQRGIRDITVDVLYDAKLVDGYAFDDELERLAQRALGQRVGAGEQLRFIRRGEGKGALVIRRAQQQVRKQPIRLRRAAAYTVSEAALC